MDRVELAKRAYHAYGKVTDFKNYQGLPMPEWDDLTPTIQQAWQAAAWEAMSAAYLDLTLDEREQAQVAHAQAYADHYSSAGVPGHGQFILIAKLARKLGL